MLLSASNCELHGARLWKLLRHCEHMQQADEWYSEGKREAIITSVTRDQRTQADLDRIVSTLSVPDSISCSDREVGRCTLLV